MDLFQKHINIFNVFTLSKKKKINNNNNNNNKNCWLFIRVGVK